MWAQLRVKNMTRSWTRSWSAQSPLGGICLCFRCVGFGQTLSLWINSVFKVITNCLSELLQFVTFDTSSKKV